MSAYICSLYAPSNYDLQNIRKRYLLLPLDLLYQEILLQVQLTVYVGLHSLLLVLHPLLPLPELLDLVS